MKTETEKATGLTFPCECKGCWNRPANLNEVWHTGQITEKLEGYYFSGSTRRFFSSRINNFRHLDNGSLAIRESLAGDMNNETRVHRVTVWCRYGHILTRDIATDTFTTGAKANKAMHTLPTNAANTCECHGCQLDKVGR